MVEHLSCITIQRWRVLESEQGHARIPFARGSGYTAGNADSKVCSTTEIAGPMRTCMSE